MTPFAWHWKNTRTDTYGFIMKSPEELGVSGLPDYVYTPLHAGTMPVRQIEAADDCSWDKIDALICDRDGVRAHERELTDKIDALICERDRVRAYERELTDEIARKIESRASHVL